MASASVDSLEPNGIIDIVLHCSTSPRGRRRLAYSKLALKVISIAIITEFGRTVHANPFEDRDLQPTLGLRSVAKGLLPGHLALDEAELASVFPGSEAARPMRGLLHI